MDTKLILPFDDIEPRHLSAVGGKGLHLALLARAGLPVPPGFCVTSEFFNVSADDDKAVVAHPTKDVPRRSTFRPPHSALLSSYRALGSPLVAVRSSAAAEDGEEHSFAGQQETILGVQGDEQLLTAVTRCFDSWNSPRARAYREQKGFDADHSGMAVVVQRLVHSEISGVLFTRDPSDATGTQMLVEASYGLGELIVSGRVTPDRFHVARASGALLNQKINVKTERMTANGIELVDPALRSAPCLSADQLCQLTELGRRVEDFYQSPRDIEWGFSDGQFWLLQARPVTTAGAYEREQLRQREIAALRRRAEPARTVWAKYNLAEVLPAPTPMTWAIVRRFMSGRGGYGLMFRDLGFDPDPVLDNEGFIDLVCGRPYVNLSREPKLYFRDFPYGYDFATLKAYPEKAIYPTPAVQSAQATGRMWFRLPLIVWRMLRSSARIAGLMKTTADVLRQSVFPDFLSEVDVAANADWSQLAPQELLDRLQHWTDRTLVDFARHSLRPSLFAATALARLEAGLNSTVGEDRAAAAARELVAGVHPDSDSDLAGALKSFTSGKLLRDDFLRTFGHRGPQEMELSAPRWSESPDSLPTITSAVADLPATPHSQTSGLAKLTSNLQRELELARTYLALRETSKHHLMRGYSLIRRALVELDRLFRLRGGIFFLTPDELPQLIAGEHLNDRIAERRKMRQTQLTLDVAPVIFSDSLDSLGIPTELSAGTGGSVLEGTAVSAGVVEGEAVVLQEPYIPPTLPPGFILVCPSTDPAWVPLFLKSAGLVMETGGILSHGAIVAREFGLPAVVGIADVHRRIKTGQKLRVDGNRGRVEIL